MKGTVSGKETVPQSKDSVVHLKKRSLQRPEGALSPNDDQMMTCRARRGLRKELRDLLPLGNERKKRAQKEQKTKQSKEQDLGNHGKANCKYKEAIDELQWHRGAEVGLEMR